ncbi:MAG: MvaI/BcnI family restriction endonuclease [Candidatus Magasanikbacteria bacterium]|nr:MvaI/BcnI family restriction endonuclease [Candidatus Magasanikbacteria bacterium]
MPVPELRDIIRKLSIIKHRGYIQSLRRGPTGIGFTLETLLDIEENNISAPDLGTIELKAQRENHAGMTTLFTFNNKAWQINPLEAIRRYGSPDKDGRMGMYYTMSAVPNSAGLLLVIDDELVSIRHIDGTIIATWKLADIEKRFDAKVKNVLLVKAKTEERDGVEYFLYDRARLLSGGTTKNILKSQFENGQLLIDLRLHDKGTTARNHGTGFRVYESNLENLYERIEEIDF